MHGIPSFQMFSMRPLSRPPRAIFDASSGVHLEMELRCRSRSFSKRPFGFPPLPNGLIRPAVQSPRAPPKCTLPQLDARLARVGFEGDEVWARPPRDDCCAAVAHPDDKQHTRSVLERSRRAKTACRVRLMWRLLAGRRGRVVLHPGSGMRKASHERFFSHSPPPSSTGAEQSHPCMLGGWAEIASPRLPRDRLLILKTGPMSGRGIAETKCQEFAATEAALARPWPRRVIDRSILARLPSAPERQGPRGHQLGGLQRHAVDEQQHLER